MALAAWGTPPALAHTQSETFLTLLVSPTNVSCQWDVALRDLQQKLPLPSQQPEAWSAVERENALDALVVDTVARLEIKRDGRPLRFSVTDLETVRLNAGEYKRVKFGSALVALVAGTWMAERLFQFKLLPF